MDNPSTAQSSPTRDIVATAAASGNFTILAVGLKDTGLAVTLRGRGPFTVFAPTDAAFHRLAPRALEALLKNTGKLKAILTYHLVADFIETKHLKSGALMTLQGSALDVSIEASKISVNGQRVSEPDLVAVNGVIHAIDAVMLPRGWKLLPDGGAARTPVSAG